jgi:hypothetical protein
VVAGLAEPAQRDAVLFAANDLVVSVFVIAWHVTLIALVLSAIGEVRAGRTAVVAGTGSAEDADADRRASLVAPHVAAAGA